MSGPPEPIAIVGMGCVFPGARNLAEFEANLLAGKDAIAEVPPGRWDPSYYDPASSAADRFYCRRGGFVDGVATFDPLAFGVMPRAAEGAEPDQLLALHVAAEAIADAGLDPSGEWRRGAAVVLGRGGYAGAGLARLDLRVRALPMVRAALEAHAPRQAREVAAALEATLPPYGPDTAIGLVPNLAASRIANRFDLGGAAYTVDAACASALLAVDQAARELWSGRADVALAGGVHLSHDVTFWSVFTQLGALSRRQEIRPFDRGADGLLIGEGAGILVLERLSDALREGRRIWARLLSVGIASDGRGTSLMSPRVEGQLFALERAWQAAGRDPSRVGLVEGHGTGTAAGDEAELTTLARFFGSAPDGRRAALGSVKSMIGHAMPAAGAAGLIKAALALHRGVALPSLHCDEPHPLLARTRFRVPAAAEPWPLPGPRLAAVDAFGFGGIDTHAVLEADGEPRRARSRPSAAGGELAIVLAAGSPEELAAALDAPPARPAGGPCRLVLFDPTPERVAMARRAVLRAQPWRGHDDLWYTPRGLAADGGRTAFLFPGVEPTFEPRVGDVAEWMGREPPAAADPGDLERVGLSIVATSRLLFDALLRLGIVPGALAGHSIGEWTAMICASLVLPAEADAFIATLVPGTLAVPDVAFAAAGCGLARAEEAIAGLPDITVSHDNCPHQVVLCGREAPLEEGLARLRGRQILAQRLPFRSGFHSPLFADYVAPHRRNLARLPIGRAGWPLWSATTCSRYPDDPAAVRELAAEHLVRPVRFRELIERLYADGCRIFVQVGAGASLVGFVQDTLRGRPHLAIAANVPKRSGLAQLRRLLAAAFCEGLAVDPGVLGPKASGARPLNLSVFAPRLAPAAPPEEAATGVLGLFTRALQTVARAQEDVVAAYARRAPAVVEARETSERRSLSPSTHPYLLDHSFYRQPPGWPELSDRYPVVPMTLLLEWLREAGEACAGRPAVAFEEVRAHRWLAIAPPIEVTLRAARRDADRVAASVDGFAEGILRFAPAGVAAWTRPPPLVPAEPPPVEAGALYRDRWMFHGPAYQGVRSIEAFGPGGIDGTIVTPEAPGALLDCAGQLFGFWIMQRVAADRMAFPVRIARVDFFGPAPRPGEPVRCAVRVGALGEREVRADLWLWRPDGRPFCRIAGWEDRRFDTDERLWELLRWPEKNLLAIPRDAYVRVTDPWRSLASRDLLARRYLGARERAVFEALPPRRQGPWLDGRIAAKDAIRRLLWSEGAGPLFPGEIELENDAAGRPRVRGGAGRDVAISLAHVEGAAVARAVRGAPAGIDLERPAPRPEGFAALVLGEDERRLLPEGDEWLARAWTAKEALAKARGEGLRGDPRRLPIQERDGERLRIDGSWVRTVHDEPFLIAWI